MRMQLCIKCAVLLRCHSAKGTLFRSLLAQLVNTPPFPLRHPYSDEDILVPLTWQVRSILHVVPTATIKAFQVLGRYQSNVPPCRRRTLRSGYGGITQPRAAKSTQQVHRPQALTCMNGHASKAPSPALVPRASHGAQMNSWTHLAYFPFNQKINASVFRGGEVRNSHVEGHVQGWAGFAERALHAADRMDRCI